MVLSKRWKVGEDYDRWRFYAIRNRNSYAIELMVRGCGLESLNFPAAILAAWAAVTGYSGATGHFNLPYMYIYDGETYNPGT